MVVVVEFGRVVSFLQEVKKDKQKITITKYFFLNIFFLQKINFI